MAKYMWTGSYTAEGTKGVIAEGGSARRAVVEKMLASMGGKLETFYFSFGSDDVVIIVDAPDNVSAAAVGLTVAASGAVRGKLTVLLTPEEIDRAAKKTPVYKKPGA
ncbi:MAG: GYD domain-containing protein [Rhizobiales bacterium]|nr:GYD domain-containing protein [Hyphomicrobiales bacterium]